MGSVFSKDQSSDCKIGEGDVGASPQIEQRRRRRRSAVKPPAQSIQEDSVFEKTSTIVNNIDDFNKKWDSGTIGFIVIGVVFVAIFLYFGIPAYYEYLKQKLSS